MRDKLVVAALVLAFATLVTVHVSLAARLVLRTHPRWRGLVALLVPPFAPLWGWRAGLRASSALWMGALLVYVVALLIARS